MSLRLHGRASEDQAYLLLNGMQVATLAQALFQEDCCAHSPQQCGEPTSKPKVARVPQLFSTAPCNASNTLLTHLTLPNYFHYYGRSPTSVTCHHTEYRTEQKKIDCWPAHLPTCRR